MLLFPSNRKWVNNALGAAWQHVATVWHGSMVHGAYPPRHVGGILKVNIFYTDSNTFSTSISTTSYTDLCTTIFPSQ